MANNSFNFGKSYTHVWKLKLYISFDFVCIKKIYYRHYTFISLLTYDIYIINVYVSMTTS